MTFGGFDETLRATYVHLLFSGRKFTGDSSQFVELLLHD